MAGRWADCAGVTGTSGSHSRPAPRTGAVSGSAVTNTSKPVSAAITSASPASRAPPPLSTIPVSKRSPAASGGQASGVTGLMDALNSAYDVKEGRPFWKVRLIALGLTVALGVLVIGGATLITGSAALVNWTAALVGLGPVVQTVLQIINYVVGIGLLLVGVGLIYYFAPNVEQDWHWITPGSFFATVTFLIASFLFSLYLCATRRATARPTAASARSSC